MAQRGCLCVVMMRLEDEWSLAFWNIVQGAWCLPDCHGPCHASLAAFTLVLLNAQAVAEHRIASRDAVGERVGSDDIAALQRSEYLRPLVEMWAGMLHSLLWHMTCS